MKKLRKLTLSEFDKISREEADNLRGGLDYTITSTNPQCAYSVGIGSGGGSINYPIKF